MKIRSILVGTALAVYAGVLPAQSSPTISTDPVIVTATRQAQTVDETLASVSVITREDIERRQPQDLVELLRTQAGVDVLRSGGFGGNVDLFLRGANQEHTLVLIDGVRVASTPNGSFEWRSLPLAQIERIEIVRGPRASLYGSDAIGGVIQIFTRRPKEFDGAVAAGSDRTRRAEVAYGTEGRTRAFFTASHFETEGFSAQNAKSAFFDPDDDGSRRQGLSLGFVAEPGAQTRFEITGRQSRGFAEFDQGTADINNGSLSARLAHAVTPAWNQSLTVGLMNDELFIPGAFPTRFATKRHSVDWQNDFVLDADSELTLGLAYLEESGESGNPVSGVIDFDERQHNRAAFALWQCRLGEHDFQLAARHDDYSTVGGHGTWSLAWGRKLGAKTRGWLSYGTAFHAPTFIDLFYPGLGGQFAGNPNLVPERSRTAEAGVRHRAQNHVFSVALFDTRVSELVNSSGPNFQSINIDKATARGAEFEYTYTQGAWYASAALTLQHTRDETTGNRLPRRADRMLSAIVQRRFDRAAVAAELVAASDRFDGSFSNVTVPGFGIVNVAARYRLRKSLSLEGRVENLLDKEYEIINGFNTPDRSLFVTLRYQPASDL